MGVGALGWDATLSTLSHHPWRRTPSPRSALFQQRDCTLELMGSFVFSLNRMISLPPLHSIHAEAGTRGQVTAPGDPGRCCPQPALQPGGKGHKAESSGRPRENSISEVSLHLLTRERTGANPRTEAPEAASGRRKGTGSEHGFWSRRGARLEKSPHASVYQAAFPPGPGLAAFSCGEMLVTALRKSSGCGLDFLTHNSI